MSLLDKLGLVTKEEAKMQADFAQRAQKTKLENLTTEAKRLRKDKQAMQEKLDDANGRIEVLEKRVDDSRELAKKEICLLYTSPSPRD